MPIALSITESAYRLHIEQGSLGSLVDGRPCPATGCPSRLVATTRRRRRGVVVADGAVLKKGSLVVALARCALGHWRRVLPANVLARKVFTVEAQALSCAVFFRGRMIAGLRVAVRRLGPDGPHFTTLHGWLGGMGAFALGLLTPPDALPVALLRAETARRLLPDLDRVWSEPVSVPAARWRTTRRRDELAGVMQLLRIAAAVAEVAVSSAACDLSEWLRLGASWCGVTPFAWSSRSRGTPIQPGTPGRVVGFGTQPIQKEEPCRNRTRSPPGASR